MENIEIFPLNETYIDSILNIEEKVFSEPWSRTMFNFILKDERSLYIAAIKNDVVVGYGGIYLIHPEANLDNIAVHPDYLGSGIGDLILVKLISLAVEREIKLIMLEVRDSNEKAIRLYEKHGFTKVGRRSDYYKKPTEDAILMDLDLEKNGS